MGKGSVNILNNILNNVSKMNIEEKKEISKKLNLYVENLFKGENMEIENVLEVEFIPIWDNNFVWKITKQNEDILKIGEFKDSNLNVYSSSNYDYIKDTNSLYIKGEDTDYYYNCGVYKFCTLKEKKLIEDKIEKINEKYGTKKIWRAKNNEVYYYITNTLTIEYCDDINEYFSNERYRLGNYFRTIEQAEEYVEKIKSILKENI